MYGGRQFGFREPSEKGLFTFYKEQEGEDRISTRKERADLTIQLGNKLPELTPPRVKKDSISFFHLSPHSLRDEHTINITKRHSKAFPSPKTNNRNRISPLPLGGSTIRHQPTNVIHVTFQPNSSPRDYRRREPKPRARTQASPTAPFPHSTPLKQLRQNFRRKEDHQYQLSTQRHEPQLLKMKAIIVCLNSLKKSDKNPNEDPIPQLRQQSEPMLHKWSSMKPIVKPLALLSPKQQPGLSISFWEHFQQRKNFLLGRYKRERANRPHLNNSLLQRRPKPVLTNNHI